ncbi:hypothetical protein GYH30_005604 [Glycine max]|uniref:Uncharacterized protein n=1 Tax=Glycine soja TaxID=3848 RepID=A0A445LVT7_GLYSO|nr:hypothetical protein GYH30_005604 [Glycine max]RZC27333.1 hypothetical protein D0Y65_005451 [Glycine soja]
MKSSLKKLRGKLNASEKLRQMRPSLSRKFSSYVLATPVDAKSSTSSGSNNPKPSNMQANLSEPTKNLWHSSPLEQKKHDKDMGNEFSGSIIRSAQSLLKEIDSLLSSNRDYISAYSKKIKRHAFSGPLTSNLGPTNPVNCSLSSSPKVSPSASLTLMTSPQISELHELPRPPTSFPSNSRLLGLVGHSGPLVSRVAALHVPRTLEFSHRSSIFENIASPPRMPIELSSIIRWLGLFSWMFRPKVIFKPGLFCLLFSYFLLFCFPGFI